MRILLAGPLPHDNKNGGVAIFTKNLAIELYNQGYQLEVISTFNGYINSNIKVNNYFHTLRVLKRLKPTVIISSLAFSSLFLFTSSKIIKIHLLHGFTNFKDYNFLKVFLMHVFDCIVRKRFTYVLSNSKFTKFINEEIFNIKSDGLFRIGLSDLYINRIKNASNMIKKGHLVLYVGRMINAKNVKLIYRAFNIINSDKTHLNFIGYGPDSSWLINKSKCKNNILFLGFKPNKDIFNYYRRSKVFISLNPAEPYGITYFEALLNNDFIIAPNTGGQVDILKKFPKRCKLVNVNDINDIVKAIKYGLNVHLSSFKDTYNIDKFSYSKTLSDIEKVIFK